MAGPNLKTLTLEYRAFGSFDGSTPAPPFSEGVLDARQIYVFEAVNIGIIPLQFGEEPPTSDSTIARKVMTWMLTYGTVINPPPTAVLTLALANYHENDPPIALQSLVEQNAGTLGVYSQRCQSIPQGYALRISNLVPLPGMPAILRIRIVQPASPEDEASWMAACCCKAGFIDTQIPAPG